MGFERDLAEAIETGRQMRRSSSSYSGYITDEIWAVAREYPNPTAETIEAAKAAFQDYVDGLNEFRAESDAIVRCDKGNRLIDIDDPGLGYHVCPYHCET